MLSFLSQQAQGKRYDSRSFVTACLIRFSVELRMFSLISVGFLVRRGLRDRPWGKPLIQTRKRPKQPRRLSPFPNLKSWMNVPPFSLNDWIRSQVSGSRYSSLVHHDLKVVSLANQTTPSESFVTPGNVCKGYELTLFPNSGTIRKNVYRLLRNDFWDLLGLKSVCK